MIIKKLINKIKLTIISFMAFLLLFVTVFADFFAKNDPYSETSFCLQSMRKKTKHGVLEDEIVRVEKFA